MVSIIFYFHPYLGKWFFRWVETTNQKKSQNLLQLCPCPFTSLFNLVASTICHVASLTSVSYRPYSTPINGQGLGNWSYNPYKWSYNPILPILTHRIHGTNGIVTYRKNKDQLFIVVKYTVRPMDPSYVLIGSGVCASALHDSRLLLIPCWVKHLPSEKYRKPTWQSSWEALKILEVESLVSCGIWTQRKFLLYPMAGFNIERYSMVFIWFPGWWFQVFFYVHPYLGKVPILTNIFQRGWNHQLGYK